MSQELTPSRRDRSRRKTLPTLYQSRHLASLDTGSARMALATPAQYRPSDRRPCPIGLSRPARASRRRELGPAPNKGPVESQLRYLCLRRLRPSRLISLSAELLMLRASPPSPRRRRLLSRDTISDRTPLAARRLPPVRQSLMQIA